MENYYSKNSKFHIVSSNKRISLRSIENYKVLSIDMTDKPLRYPILQSGKLKLLIIQEVVFVVSVSHAILKSTPLSPYIKSRLQPFDVSYTSSF